MESPAVCYLLVNFYEKFAAFTEAPPICRDSDRCSRRDCKFIHEKDYVAIFNGSTKMCKFCAAGNCKGMAQPGFYCVPEGFTMQCIPVTDLPNYGIQVPAFLSEKKPVRNQPTNSAVNPSVPTAPLFDQPTGEPIQNPTREIKRRPPVKTRANGEHTDGEPNRQKPNRQKSRKELSLVELAALQKQAAENLTLLLAQVNSANSRDQLFNLLKRQGKLAGELKGKFYAN